MPPLARSDPAIAGRRIAPTAPREAPAHAPLDRHAPALAATLRAALSSRLSPTDFPYLRNPPPAEGAFAAAAATGDADYGPGELGEWAYHGRGPGYTRPSRPYRRGRKLVVVMLGGSSHAELRCVHDILGEQAERGEPHGGCEVYFGSTAVLTPLQYVRALQETPPSPPLATF